MPEPTVTTHQLSDLTGFIRRVFALNLPSAVWVAAEIGQANVSRGNCWLTLIQKDPEGNSLIAQMDGVVWKGGLDRLRRAYGVKLIRDLFQDGMSVRLKVTTSFHPRYGLRLVVEDIDPSHTLGELERRRRLTLEKLAAEGLLTKNGQLHLSPIPQNLAVISSDTAAGLADFTAQLENNLYGYNFKLRMFPAAMQGVKTGPEITARLRQIKSWGEVYDAVVIVRGGGGRTDLAAFDDEGLARAVANYHLPVIAGIGHETDDAVLDRVVHTSLKTPTAAAVYLVETIARAESKLLNQSRAIIQSASNALYHEQPKLVRVRSEIQNLATASIVRENNKLDRVASDLQRIPKNVIATASRQLDSSEKLLTALRPETTLARGFALVIQNGKLITASEELIEGEVEVRLKNGRSVLHKK